MSGVVHPFPSTPYIACRETTLPFILYLTSMVQISGLPRGVWGVQTSPRNSEGPPKSCQTQPDCENC